MYLLTNYRSVFLLWPVLCIILNKSAAAITDTDCTPAHQTNGDKKCKDVDTNAECPANGKTCACKTGYKVDPDHATKCLQIVITQVTCSPGDAGDTKCLAEDENSKCLAGTSKCACKEGFTGSNICAKSPITQVGCSPGTDGDNKCKGLDEHSECPTGATKCACKSEYTGIDTCTKIITQVDCSPGADGDTTCKGVDENSECPSGATKCACKTGYKGTDTCSKESSANSAKATTTLIVMSILILIFGPLM